MVGVLDYRSCSPGSSPSQDTALCSWARSFTLTVPFSTQVYKQVLANLTLRGNPLWWTSIPSRGRRNILRFSMLRTWEELWPDLPLGSYINFTFIYLFIYLFISTRKKATGYFTFILLGFLVFICWWIRFHVHITAVLVFGSNPVNMNIQHL